MNFENRRGLLSHRAYILPGVVLPRVPGSNKEWLKNGELCFKRYTFLYMCDHRLRNSLLHRYGRTSCILPRVTKHGPL